MSMKHEEVVAAAAQLQEQAQAAQRGPSPTETNYRAFDAAEAKFLSGEVDRSSYFATGTDRLRASKEALLAYRKGSQQQAPTAPAEAVGEDRDVALQREHERLTSRLQEIEAQFSWAQSQDEAA